VVMAVAAAAVAAAAAAGMGDKRVEAPSVSSSSTRRPQRSSIRRSLSEKVALAAPDVKARSEPWAELVVPKERAGKMPVMEPMVAPAVKAETVVPAAVVPAGTPSGSLESSIPTSLACPTRTLGTPSS